MVTVAEELPFAAAVRSDKLETVCSNCFVQKKKDECNFLTAADICPNTATRFLCRVIMRVKKGDLPTAFNGRTFGDLMDHADNFIKHEEQLYKEIYASAGQFIGLENVPSEKEFLSIFGKVKINSFEIQETWGYHDELGFGLYLGFSTHDHSCRPNCSYFFNGSKAVLRAQDPNAKYSKDLTISYVVETYPREFRRERLRETYFFDCQCERCTDEEEELLERSGRSLCCPDGVVLPRENNKSLFCFGQPLKCSKCGKKSSITLKQINAANEELAIFCDTKVTSEISERVAQYNEEHSVRAEVAEFLKTFDRMERVLSPYNLYLFKFCEFLKKIHNFVYDETIVLDRLLQAEEKAIERFAPFGFYKACYIISRLTLEKEAVKAMECPPEEKLMKILDAMEKAHSVVKNVFGAEHPVAVGIEDSYKYLTNEYTRIAKRMAEIGKERGDYLQK